MPSDLVASHRLLQAYLTTRVPIEHRNTRAAAALARLRTNCFENADYVFVTDESGRLLRAVSTSAVLSARDDAVLDQLLDAGVPVVSPDLDREDAGSIAIHHRAATLAVCDGQGRFIGAVTASALISILRDEHLEDLHHMAGIMSRSEAAKRALSESPVRRAWYRLPWLLVGMIGSGVATSVMASYEQMLAANIAVTFFVPAIVYLADAVGTQSEAVAVRGLSLAAPGVPRLLAGEITTGILIGAVLAAFTFAAVWLGFGSARLAATVGASMFAAGAVATAVGSLLPWAFNRLGYDPAYGSGPVGTVIQDVLSLFIYFSIASWLIFPAPV